MDHQAQQVGPMCVMHVQQMLPCGPWQQANAAGNPPVLCDLCVKAALSQQLTDSILNQVVDVLLNSLLEYGMPAMATLAACQDLLNCSQAVDEVQVLGCGINRELHSSAVQHSHVCW